MAKAKNKTENKAAGKVMVEITAFNMAGKYLMPYSPGHIVELEAKQAEEIIEAGDGKPATSKQKK